MGPQQPLSCPLCCQLNFPNIESLKLSLIKVTSRPIPCPICSEVILGLDKLTIHLFAHSVFPDLSVKENAQFDQKRNVEDLKLVRKPRCRKKEMKNTNLERENPSGDLEVAVVANHNGTQKYSHQINFQQSQNFTQEQAPVYVSFKNEPGQIVSPEQQIRLIQQVIQSHQPISPALVTAQIIPNALPPPISAVNFSPKFIKTDTPKCDTCDLNFSDDNLLSMHEKLVHEPLDQVDDAHKFQCHLCQKSFKMKGSLRIHLRVAHYGFNIRFNGGGQSCNQLLNHSPVNQEVDNDTNGGSGDCGLIQPKQPLSIQLKLEGNVCDICGKNFTTKYFLKKHKRLHTGETPYACNICNKTFTFQQSYHKHLLYHNDEKPHVCPTCGRAFKELSTLHNHERIHSGEKPFKCETCGKCFRQRVSYLVHRRIHTGVMPYRCTACNKSFRYKVSQRTHKCTNQPPGTVVRQTGDLLQKLLQSAAIFSAPSDPSHSSNNHNEDSISKTLDELINESCNKMGIVEDQQYVTDEPLNVPSPSEGMQNLCLVSPVPEIANFEQMNRVESDQDDAFRNFFT